MNNWVKGDLLDRGKYTIDDVLGSGGFGITYLATNNDTGKKVAIKTLSIDLQKRPDFDYFKARFLDEAKRLEKCQHQNIVKFYGQFQEGQLPCLVMEYIEGKNLSKIVSEQGVLQEDCALSYIQQISEALTFVHSLGILHRDLKPENIMLRKSSPEVVLIDFGIARDLTPNQINCHTKNYTYGYTPPEQCGVSQDKPGNYTDVYALAATLYVLLTGYNRNKLSFNYLESALDRYLKVEKSKADPLQPPQHHNPKISDRVNYAILKGMEIQAAKRPQTVREWLALLDMNHSTYQGQTLQIPGIKSLTQTAITHYNLLTTNKLFLGSLFCFVAVIYYYSPYLTLSQRSEPIKPPDESQSPELAPPEKPESPPIDKNKEVQRASEETVKTLDIDYKSLHNLLNSRKFEDADRKTLSIMLSLVERQKKNWFEAQDIKNIPCKDLHKINQLWLEYSDQRFGFSVQKQIWTEVGGETGVYNVQIADHFIARVGWGGQSSRYDNITYDSSAPVGHLPFRVTTRIGKFGAPYLAERLASCNIP